MLQLQQMHDMAYATFYDVDTEGTRTRLAKERAKITKAARFRTIAGVMAKHGLLHFFQDRKSAKREHVSSSDSAYLRNLGRRLTLAFEELGPTFIKLGQVLVTRQELLPAEVTEELRTLLDRVPPIPFEEVATVMLEELPEGIHMFEMFDREPIGSASLAQVYRARLKNGKDCAVKIVRPNVDKLFQTDIAIVKKLVRMVQKRLPVSLQAALSLPDLIGDYYSSSVNELDMQNEARAMEEHRVMSAEFATVHVPEVYFSSKNVLIQEFVDGWTVKEFPVDFFTFEERVERMVDLAHYYIKTFQEGYYHGDAHGSNILVDRHTKQCVVIDFGMMGRMDSIHTDAIFRMLMHIRINQAEDAAECAMDILHPTPYTQPAKVKDQLRSMMIHYVTSTQDSVYNWGNLVIQIITIGMTNYCKIPAGLALWAKGFSAAEGTARWLCPEISYHHVVETADIAVLRGMTARRFNFRANASLLSETFKLVTTLPRRMNKILEHLSWNDTKLAIETKIDPASVQTLSKLTNRVTLAALAGSLFVGGSILQAFAVGRVGGAWVNFFADAGLMGAGILSVFLIWKVIRS